MHVFTLKNFSSTSLTNCLRHTEQNNGDVIYDARAHRLTSNVTSLGVGSRVQTFYMRARIGSFPHAQDVGVIITCTVRL